MGVSYLQLAAYGGALALAAFVLTWYEFRRAARMFSPEVCVAVIAVLFVLLGIWVGRQMQRPAGPEKGFARNDAALDALGVASREYAVLELLAEGQANKEIARSLGISTNTVKTHLSHLFGKLEVSRRTQAIAKARELSLIP